MAHFLKQAFSRLDHTRSSLPGQTPCERRAGLHGALGLRGRSRGWGHSEQSPGTRFPSRVSPPCARARTPIAFSLQRDSPDRWFAARGRRPRGAAPRPSPGETAPSARHGLPPGQQGAPVLVFRLHFYSGSQLGSRHSPAHGAYTRRAGSHRTGRGTSRRGAPPGSVAGKGFLLLAPSRPASQGRAAGRCFRGTDALVRLRPHDLSPPPTAPSAHHHRGG